MSEANQASDESPVRPVVRRDATIRPEVPARSHEVRECPFCGRERPYAQDSGVVLKRWRYRCYRCDAIGPAEPDQLQALIAWNRRALPSAREAETRTQRGEG